MADFNEKQSMVLEVLFSPEAGGDVKKAMNIAGYDPKYAVSTFLKAEGMKEAIHKETSLFLASTGPKAVNVVYGLLEGKGKLGDREKLMAAKDLLDRNNFKGTEKVEVEVSSPLFILPPKEDDDQED